jgi:hypothetical protein
MGPQPRSAAIIVSQLSFQALEPASPDRLQPPTSAPSLHHVKKKFAELLQGVQAIDELADWEVSELVNQQPRTRRVPKPELAAGQTRADAGPDAGLFVFHIANPILRGNSIYFAPDMP